MPVLRQRLPEIAFEFVADIARVSMPRREADVAIRQHTPGMSPDEVGRHEPGRLWEPACSSSEGGADRADP